MNTFFRLLGCFVVSLIVTVSSANAQPVAADVQDENRLCAAVETVDREVVNSFLSGEEDNAITAAVLSDTDFDRNQAFGCLCGRNSDNLGELIQAAADLDPDNLDGYVSACVAAVPEALDLIASLITPADGTDDPTPASSIDGDLFENSEAQNDGSGFTP